MEESHTRSKPYDDDVLARTRRGPLEQAEKCNRGVGAETPLAVALPPPLTAAAATLSMSVCDGQPHHPLHITAKKKKRLAPAPFFFHTLQME